MKEEVNLLTTQEKKEKKTSSLFSVSLFMLLVVVIASVGILFYSLLLKINIQGITREQSALLTQMKNNEGKKIKQQTIKERLAAIQGILPERNLLSDRLDLISSGITGGVSIDTVTADNKTITIPISSPNLLSIDQVLSSELTSITERKNANIKRIDVDGFGFSRTNSFYKTFIRFSF